MSVLFTILCCFQLIFKLSHKQTSQAKERSSKKRKENKKITSIHWQFGVWRKRIASADSPSSSFSSLTFTLKNHEENEEARVEGKKEKNYKFFQSKHNQNIANPREKICRFGKHALKKWTQERKKRVVLKRKSLFLSVLRHLLHFYPHKVSNTQRKTHNKGVLEVWLTLECSHLTLQLNFVTHLKRSTVSLVQGKTNGWRGRGEKTEKTQW